MKKFCSLLLVCSLISILFYGCKEPDSDHNKPAIPKVNPINILKYKGMYSVLQGEEKFKLCGSNSEFLISDQSEFKDLENTFPGLRSKINGKKFYSEAEGFPSVKENLKLKSFDTVLVITRFIKVDTTYNCE